SLPTGEERGEPHHGWDTPWDPFHYERRATRAVRLGQVGIGGPNVVAVVARIGTDAETRLLRWASPGNRRLPRPDIVEWPVPDHAAVATLGAARSRLDEARALARLVPSVAPKLPAVAPGSLLCDGMGDAVQAGTAEAGQDETQLTLDVLQGSGTRLSKTDYVACPSCGRTLFDLQSTTERIKAQTAHLAGVKIAIMG